MELKQELPLRIEGKRNSSIGKKNVKQEESLPLNELITELFFHLRNKIFP